jgi:hypothetical protein
MTAPCWFTNRAGDSAAIECECPVLNSSWSDFGAATKGGQHCQGVVSTVPGDFDMRIIPGGEYALDACVPVDW